MAIAACSLVCAMPPASRAMGDSTVTFYDTVCCQEPYIFFGNEHTYVCVDLENEPYVNHELEHYDEVADILYICKLTIVPIRRVAVEDTILLGDTLFFCGDTLLDAGVYEYTLTSAVDCDSVVNAIGFLPADVAAKGKGIHKVGTCVSWGNLRDVVWNAWDVCMKI